MRVSLTDRFATNLKVARKARGMTQEALAVAAKVAPAYVSMLENGRRVPPLDTVEQIATALDVEPLSLLRDTRPAADVTGGTLTVTL